MADKMDMVRSSNHQICHWLGLSLGWVTVIWLTHILSMRDHRLNHVEKWAGSHLHILGSSTGKEVEALDFSGDRLGDILRALSDDEGWDGFENDLNGQTVRVYNLKANRVRLDAIIYDAPSTASWHTSSRLNMGFWLLRGTMPHMFSIGLHEGVNIFSDQS